MSFTIRDKAATVGTFRSIHVSLMETLAGWVPTTPEFAAKILFGRHIWTIAQHVDALGRRAYELRKPLQYSALPAAAYRRILASLSSIKPIADRMTGLYDVILPGLARRYVHYLAQTDQLLDAPTVRLFEQFLADAAHMRQEAQDLYDAFLLLPGANHDWVQRLTALEAQAQAVDDTATLRPPAANSAMTVTIDTADTMAVRGVTLRRDPAREACFQVVHSATDMHEYADMSEVSRRERLHRHMNNEMGSLEIAAQCLADFPAAPWALRLQLARQCWDETRHVQLLYRRLQELGGHKGEFPIANLEWTVTCMLDSLPARLAVQNRTFEAGQMDLLGSLVDRWREAGDETTAHILEGILADEIQHVRFANQWIKRFVRDDRRILLHIATAMRFLTHATMALANQPGAVNAVGTVLVDPTRNIPKVNVEDRRQADFTDDEINQILRQAGFRSLTRTPETEGAAR